MSSSAQVSQVRTALPTAGGTIFQITATVNDPGTLPDNGFFLYQIGADADPTTDVFARVSTLADYAQVNSSGYGLSRWTAIANGISFYRTPDMSITFNDINTATAGQTSLNDNINALVNAYEAFSTSFATGDVPDEIYYPTSDPSILSGLITTWQTSHNATLVAQTAAQTAASTLAQAQISLTSAQTLMGVVTNINSAVVVPQQQALTDYTTLATALEAIINNAESILGTPQGGFPGSLSPQLGTTLFNQLDTLLYSIQTDLPYFTAAPAAQTDLSYNFNTFYPSGGATTIMSLLAALTGAIPGTPSIPSVTVVTNALQSAAGALQTATNTFNSSAANAATTAQNLLAAQNTENTSLAAIVAVCPDFNPANPTASLS
jgi:hypothetical protein